MKPKPQTNNYFIKTYNSLDGKKISRKKLTDFYNELYFNMPLIKGSHLEFIMNKVAVILEKNPTENYFFPNIKNKLTLAGLNGSKSVKEIDLPNSNIFLKGFGRDKNGNKTIKVSYGSNRAFSIQTNGNLKYANSYNQKTKLKTLTKSDIIKIEKELIRYIQNHETKTRKKGLKVFSSSLEDKGLKGLLSRKTLIKHTKKGLKKPFSQPIAKTPKPINLKSASQILNNKVEHKHYSFNDKNLKNILGNIEIKQKDSVAITVDAPQGAMKTRFVFQIGNEFAGQGLKVLFVSLEEHPTSKLFQDKVKQYVTETNQNRFYPIGELDNNYDTLKSLIPQFDVIIIDSWNKIAETDNKLDFDRDLRKKFNSKLFITIFQRTTTGTMRGGAKSQFDGDVILKIKKFEDYKYNYVYQDKNRYMIDDYVYNIYEKKTYPRNVYLEMLEDKNLI